MRGSGAAPRLIRIVGLALPLTVVVAILLTVAALGADPSADPALEPGAAGGLLAGGDPRSEGAGPGLVGAPVLILLGVVALGLATAAVTVVLVRLTRRT